VKSNFEVLEAGDGEEALDIFYKDKDIALINFGLRISCIPCIFYM